MGVRIVAIGNFGAKNEIMDRGEISSDVGIVQPTVVFVKGDVRIISAD